MNYIMQAPVIDGSSLTGELGGVLKGMDFLANLAASGIAFGFLVLMWVVINIATRKTDDHHEMFVNRNISYLLQRYSVLAAQSFAMYATLGLKPADWSMLRWVLIDGGVIFVIILVAYPIMRTVIGRNASVVAASGVDMDPDSIGYRVKNTPRDPDKAITDPVSIALVIAGFYLAFGLAVNGVFSGDAPTRLLAYQAIAVFTALGILVPVAWYFINDLVTTRLFGYSVRAGVREGKTAAGFEAFGMLLALGIVMQSAIAGDFTDWANALWSFFVSLTFVMLATYIGRWLFNVLVIKNATVCEIHDDDNVPLATFLAGIPPIMALLTSPLAVAFASLGT